MRNKQSRKRLLIAALLAVAAGFCVFNSMNSQKTTINTLSQQLEQQQQTITKLKDSSIQADNSASSHKIIVAKQIIKVGTKITPDMLELKEYGSEKIPVDSVSNISLLTGQIAAEDINAGAPVTKSKTLGLKFADFDIPAGMRAVTIPSGYIQGLASYITVGSKVDIVSIKKDNNSEIILQGIKIISFEQSNINDSASSAKADAITLLIPANSVSSLVDAMASGKLQVVARSASDNIVVKKYIHISRNNNDIYSSNGLTIPPPPNLTKLPSIGEMKNGTDLIGVNGKKVEIIQANVKSEVNFNNDL
jgi:Flp pilus assembly protein CpaB